MIFVSVGHQMPFDRLVMAVDEWACARGRTDVFAQIGETLFTPKSFEYASTLSPSQFRTKVELADVIVAHAGTGTILTAMELAKPILVMPRRASLLETRNDHQVATAQRFKDMGRVAVAMDEHELPRMLDELSNVTPGRVIPAVASAELLKALAAFIHKDH